MTSDHPTLRQNVWHPTPDSPEPHKADHKDRRRCPTQQDSPGIVPDRPVHSQTILLHRLDRPEHLKSHMILLVRKADIKIVRHPIPKSRTSHMSLSLFSLLRPNIMFALTRTRHKKRKLNSHLILLSV
jgi:hypothetical protein